jgi:phage gp29-like protein
MAKILDQHGQPFDLKAIAEPQTARVAMLANTYIESQLGGLTPARAASILAAADTGDMAAQHRLFEDMLDRDAHLVCEIGKRKGALVTLDWSVEPPANASRAEKKAAAWVEDVLRTAVDDLEDVLLAMMDAPGHGFAPVELEWTLLGGERLPKFHPRPQDWFRMSRDRRALRLNDGSADGAEPAPMGWIWHTHGKAKTGYQTRQGLYRVLLWPFLYKSYSIGDLAEFLETYGLPIIVGKYQQGATAEEKASLMRAVTALGHDARAIMPQEMALEIQKVTGAGESAAHLAMVDWAERSQSKAILGQVLSAEAKATGMGSGVADLQGEVRRDILRSDARQIAGTLTRDLVYPLIALNLPGIDGLRRCPRFIFDDGEADDLALYADALPKLAQGGARIPVAWVHEKLRIPEAADGEAVFAAAPAPATPSLPALTPGPSPASGRGEENPLPPGEGRVRAALRAEPPVKVEDTADKMTPALAAAAQPSVEAWVSQIEAMLAGADSLEQFREDLLARYRDLPADDLVEVMAAALAAIELRGRAEVLAGR